MAQSNTVTQDTLHLLFPNLNQLLNFQRKFLIRVEGTAEMPWHEQRWGSLFSNNVSPSIPTCSLSGLPIVPGISGVLILHLRSLTLFGTTGG